MNELHAVEAVGDGGIVERAVVGRTARLHRQNGADDVLVDVGKGDDQSLGMAGGDAAVRAGLLGDITGTAGQGLRGLALGGVLQIIGIMLLPLQCTLTAVDADGQAIELTRRDLRAPVRAVDAVFVLDSILAFRSSSLP